ncbi:hypothetical protein F2Q68_00025512 [Brassica cretica]|uniref:Uncharacterized protein n=1 Tax=Brassica cretica TaxID=69181 RepID=A0A8S9II37_BRACR|nr:hypothetical protein F2Q68_00025512 [Brassica cretica]
MIAMRECHCIIPKDYMKCSMGHYAMKGCLVRTLYGDSNTLVPGIRKRAAHKTETITNLLRPVVFAKASKKDHQPGQEMDIIPTDYLREDQVESQAVSVPKMSRYKGMCTSGECVPLLGASLNSSGSSLSFSKEAVKSVERGRFQTWSMKRASRV